MSRLLSPRRFAATILGEFGAEIVKVEQPDGGDALRRFGTPSDDRTRTYAWLSEARNKRSVVLDLKSHGDKKKFLALVARADVVCENFRPGTLEKWGLGWDVLGAHNPRLVLLRISAYGQNGPYRERPGFARIAHAIGGLSYLAGMPDGPPVTPGSTSLADYISGLYGAVGVLLALRVAEHTGRGQVIDIALFESIFRVLDELAPLYARHGVVREREGVGTRNACPHGHFPCADGKWVAIACTADHIWARLATKVLAAPALAQQYPTTAKRLAARATIDTAVETFTRAHSAADVVTRCASGDVPCGVVNSIADIFADPQFAARQALSTITEAAVGAVVIPSVLPKMSLTPGHVTHLGPRLSDWQAAFEALIVDAKEVRAGAQKPAGMDSV